MREQMTRARRAVVEWMLSEGVRIVLPVATTVSITIIGALMGVLRNHDQRIVKVEVVAEQTAVIVARHESRIDDLAKDRSRRPSAWVSACELNSDGKDGRR